MVSKAEKSKKSKIPFILKMIRFMFPILEMIPPVAKAYARYLFFKPLKYPFQEPELEYLKKSVKTKVSFEGKNVCVYSWGSGTPILFVHGWSGRGAQFWKFVNPFTKSGYQVITFDAPAHGFSEGSKSNVLEFVSVINLLRKKYNIELLVGHSLGGVASMISAREMNNLIRIVTIGSPCTGKDIISEFGNKVNAQPSTTVAIPEYVESITGKSFEYFMPLKIYEELNDLPITLYHDQKDSEVPIEHARMMKNKFPQLDVFETTGLGHTRILRNEPVVQGVLEIFEKDKVNI